MNKGPIGAYATADACQDDMARGERFSAGKAATPKRLLHVFPTFGYGGVPIRISNIINHFGDKYRHTLVAMDGCFDCRTRIKPEVRIEFIETRASRYGLLTNLMRFRAAIRGVSPDIMITYNWGAIEWGLANNLSQISRHVHMESGFGVEEADRHIPRRAIMRRFALKGAQRVVVPSLTMKGIATRSWKLDPQSIEYIPNGVDCDRFAGPGPSGPCNWRPKSNGELVVGTVAPLRKEKNLGRLITAFAQLDPKYRSLLVIVGEGPERDDLDVLASTLGISDRVVFGGHVENVEDVLGSLDVFALSSDTEQMPNSLLQAMAAGLPVAAVDVGDVKHILAPENAPYVVARDGGALPEALAQLLEDPRLRRRLGQTNQAHVRRHYNEQRMFEAYECLFESIL